MKFKSINPGITEISDNFIKWDMTLILLFIFELVVMVLSGFTSFWVIPAVIGLILCVICFFLLENFLLYIYILIFPLLPLLPPRLNTLAVWSGFLILLVIWLIRTYNNNLYYESLPGYIRYFVFGFIFLSTLATLNATNLANSIVELFRIYTLFLFLMLLYNFVVKIKHIKMIFNIAITSTIIVAIISLPEILTFTPSDIISGSLVKIRLNSFYNNANNLSIPFMFSIPLLVSKLIFFEKNTKHKTLKSIFFLVAFLFFIYIVLLTNSRSAILCIVFSLFVLFMSFKIGRIISFVSISLFVLILPFIAEFLFVLLRLERGFTGRDVLWKAAIDMIKDYPFLGVGPGNYESLKTLYIIPVDFFTEFTRLEAMSGAAHNLFLTISAENGILTGIILYVFLIYVFIKFIKLIKLTNNKEYKYILYSMFAVLFGLFMRTFVESGIIIGSARINDNIYFLVPLVALARMEKIILRDKNLGI